MKEPVFAIACFQQQVKATYSLALLAQSYILGGKIYTYNKTDNKLGWAITYSEEISRCDKIFFNLTSLIYMPQVHTQHNFADCNICIRTIIPGTLRAL